MNLRFRSSVIKEEDDSPTKFDPKWNKEEIEKLLKLVKKHPIIYDVNNSTLTPSEISEAKSEAWSNISDKMKNKKRTYFCILNSYS